MYFRLTFLISALIWSRALTASSQPSNCRPATMNFVLLVSFASDLLPVLAVSSSPFAVLVSLPAPWQVFPAVLASPLLLHVWPVMGHLPSLPSSLSQYTTLPST